MEETIRCRILAAFRGSDGKTRQRCDGFYECTKREAEKLVRAGCLKILDSLPIPAKIATEMALDALESIGECSTQGEEPEPEPSQAPELTEAQEQAIMRLAEVLEAETEQAIEAQIEEVLEAETEQAAEPEAEPAEAPEPELEAAPEAEAESEAEPVRRSRGRPKGQKNQ